MNRWLLAAFIHEGCEKLKIPAQVLASALYLMDNAVVLLKDALPKDKAWYEKCEPLLLGAVCIHLASKMECCYVSLTSLLSHFFYFSPPPNTNSSNNDSNKNASQNMFIGSVSATEIQKQALYDNANSVEALLVVEMGINSALPPRPAHWELHKFCQEWRISNSLRILSFHILFQILTITPFAGRYSTRILTALCLYIASQWLQEDIVIKPPRKTVDINNETQEGWWSQIYISLRRCHLNAMLDQWLQACRILPMKIRIDLAEDKLFGVRQELERIEDHMHQYPHLETIFENIGIPREVPAGNTSNPALNNTTATRNGTPNVEENNRTPTDGTSQETEKDSASANVPNKQRISMKDYRQKVQVTRPPSDEQQSSATQMAAPHSYGINNSHHQSSKHHSHASTGSVSNMEGNPRGHVQHVQANMYENDTGKSSHHSRHHGRERNSSQSDGSSVATTVSSSGHHRHHKSHHHRHHHEHSSSKHSQKRRHVSSHQLGERHEPENILSNLLQNEEGADDMDISPS